MKPMLTAAMALLLLVNPSYGSLKRLTDALSKIGKSRRSLIEVPYNDPVVIQVPFHRQLRIDFGRKTEETQEPWTAKYDGDYTYTEIENGKPAYKMTTCRHSDPAQCLFGQKLNANVNSGKYQFGFCQRDSHGEALDPTCKHPTCFKATLTGEECTNWSVGDEVHNPTITGLGNDKVIDIAVCGEVEGDTLKDKLMNTFNCYRSQVALGNIKSGCIRNDCEHGVLLPKAAKMSPLVWNDELAKPAQDCADDKKKDGFYCSSAHCSSDTEETKWNGNQGAAAWSNTGEYEEAYGVISWVDEKREYQWGDGQDFSGHFWGVIKENHVEVGCGYRECLNNDITHHAQKVLYCNYKSNGEPEWKNEGKTYPYKPTEGVAGSECVYSANPSTGLCNL
jgi:hypothetical protein